MRILAIEFGESDVFDSSDGYVDGDGSGRHSGGRSDYGDDFCDGGGSAFGQDADVQADSDGAGAGFYVDRYGQCVGDRAGGAERHLFVFGESGGRRSF